jgi:hypothetical protein
MPTWGDGSRIRGGRMLDALTLVFHAVDLTYKAVEAVYDLVSSTEDEDDETE